MSKENGILLKEKYTLLTVLNYIFKETLQIFLQLSFHHYVSP